MKKIKLTDNIFLVRFKTQYDVCSTMLRFQEHYESPNKKFRKEAFTLEEFMDWYAKVNGNFTYYSDWSGFNVPSDIIQKFQEGCFTPLTMKEHYFLNLFDDEYFDSHKFYVIATYDDHKEWKEVIKHELAHALWYVSGDYKKEVSKLLKTADKEAYAAFKKSLLKKGYMSQVVPDELQAYLIGPSPGLGDAKALKPLSKAVKKVFDHYAKNIKYD